MKDRLCLIPYRDIMLDKTYTNISEYYLREDARVLPMMRAAGACFESGSDFELMSEFLRVCKENELLNSASCKAFSEIVKKLIGEDRAFSVSAEELWRRTSDALLESENKLRNIIANSGLESVGASVDPDEEFDDHFVRCGRVDISPVFCPFGCNTVSLDTINKIKTIKELEKFYGENLDTYDSIALFFDGFSFEIPNEYAASKALEKHSLGQTLSYKESDLLKAQLLRVVMSAAEKKQKEVMMFLPSASDVRAMGEVSALVDYLDESNIKSDITLYAGDAVGLCMAQSIAGKKYKNITAATGVSGNGSCASENDIAAYWGASARSVQRRASLAKTAAGLAEKL